MKSYGIIGALLFVIVLSAWMLDRQRDTIAEMELRIEQAEKARQLEHAHFAREIERLETVRMYELMQKEMSYEATNDKSDTGSDMFGVSRVMRVNRFNF